MKRRIRHLAGAAIAIAASVQLGFETSPRRPTAGRVNASADGTHDPIARPALGPRERTW
jgi:hypothetical protein